ncbi:MAG: hypothetical protein AAGA03_05640 [Planctomycetota bacterium]
MTMFQPLTKWSGCAASVLCTLLAASTTSAAIISDTFDRNETGTWGAVDNGTVNGETGTVAASYTLDTAGNVVGTVGQFTNNRIVLDYNLATDPDIVAAGGFRVQWQVNPTDGATGREFAGIAIGDSNQNPPYGGSGAITNGANETLRYAVLPRNSGSAGLLTRTAGNVRTLTATGAPGPDFNEVVFDQPVFDDYSNQGAPSPFDNSKFYDVDIVVTGQFVQGQSVNVATTVNGFSLDPQTIEWGVTGQAYLSAIGFNGPHQYDNLLITAVPEPSGLMALVGCTMAGMMIRRRRR